MYIGGGDLKGRAVPFKYLPVRPTTGKAKQGLFNILQNHFEWKDCETLDLFCGTGSLTCELASRGCKQVAAVDISSSCCNHVRKIIKHFGLNKVITVRSDALSFLKKNTTPFDIILCDPPYDYEHYEAIPRLVFSGNLLKPGGWLVIEHSRRTSFKENPRFVQQRVYGEVNFSFFE